MSQYRKNDLVLHIRSSRELDETVTLMWVAEIATQWSKYEYLRKVSDLSICCIIQRLLCNGCCHKFV